MQDWPPELLTAYKEQIRQMLACFADPSRAPRDADTDGVALREPPAAGEPLEFALTTRDGCSVTLHLDPQQAFSDSGQSAVYDLYTSLVREMGAHRTERDSLVLVLKEGTLKSVTNAYRRRLSQ